MTKIACYFNGKSIIGGAERRIGRILASLSSQGIEVYIVFREFEAKDKVIEVYEHVIGKSNIHYIFLHSNYDVFKYTRKSKFDCVLYTGPYREMLPFFVAAKVSHSKTILLAVSTEPIAKDFKNKLSEIEFAYLCRHSNLVDCLYPSGTSIIKERYKLNNIGTTPCPFTNTELFCPKEKEKCIVFLSRWSNGKNTELFINSVLNIQDELKNKGYIVYLCGGSNNKDYDRYLRSLAEQCKHADLIQMPGYINPEDYLPSAEIFVSIQSVDNYPSQSLIEAISCGCFIVASNEGDTERIVKNEFGVLCSLDCDDIGNSIIAAINKGENEKKTCVNLAREFALRTFRIENSVNHYKEIITCLLGANHE